MKDTNPPFYQKNFELPALPGGTTQPARQVAWQFGMNQRIQANRIRTSVANIVSPFQLSAQATGQGLIGNGTTLNFTTVLSSNPPHVSEMMLAVPYVAIYWNVADVGGSQIWPQLGSGIPGTAFSVYAGYDWHLFSGGTPGSVNASFSGHITDNSMGNGTIQLVTQWQFINFNSGTVIAQ